MTTDPELQARIDAMCSNDRIFAYVLLASAWIAVWFVVMEIAAIAPPGVFTILVYVSALVHGLLLLKRGVTGLVDHVRHGVLPSVEALGACVRAYRDLGLRATVAPIFEDCVF